LAKVQKSLAEYKKADREVQLLLKSIAPARSAIIFHEPFLKQAQGLEKVLKRLKAFLKMLTTLAKLNPMKYREWWHNVYDNPVAPAVEKVAKVSTPATQVQPEGGKTEKSPTADNKPESAPVNLPPRLYQH
jgi:hypothetical protein